MKKFSENSSTGLIKIDNRKGRRILIKKQKAGNQGMKTTEQKTALITGASSGIGAAYARRMAAEGINLIITARRDELLKKLADELSEKYGVVVEVIAADLATEEGISRLEKRTTGGPPVDILVNCAGFGTRGHLVTMAPEKITAMVNVHNLAPGRLTRAALPGMIDRNWGTIIMVASLGAFLTTAEYVVYSATKAFLTSFCTGLRDELAGTAVKVQAVCLGLVRTGFMETEEYKDFNYQDIPAFAWMSPEKVVDISMKKLVKNRRPVIITGLSNRVLVGLMNTSIIGPVIRNTLGYFSRRRVMKGEPALF